MRFCPSLTWGVELVKDKGGRGGSQIRRDTVGTGGNGLEELSFVGVLPGAGGAHNLGSECQQALAFSTPFPTPSQGQMGRARLRVFIYPASVSRRGYDCLAYRLRWGRRVEGGELTWSPRHRLP